MERFHFFLLRDLNMLNTFLLLLEVLREMIYLILKLKFFMLKMNDPFKRDILERKR